MLLKFETETEWLAARAKDVTSTEIAALFGLSPWKSRLRLWHEKKGTVESDFVDNDPAKWGRRLEIPVALGICEDNGWEGESLFGFYFTQPDLRLGTSMDVRAISRDEGPGLLEVKIPDDLSEDGGWFEDRAPIPYEFQIQTQLHLAAKDGHDIRWGRIGALGRRKATRLYRREYDRDLGAMIDAEVAAFWASIEANEPPKPDFAMDAEILEALRQPIRSGDVINLSQNNRAVELAHDYQTLRDVIAPYKAHITETEAKMKAIQAELHSMIGRNETAIVGDFQIGARVQEVEEGIRHGYTFRRFDFKQRKGK